MCVCVCVCHADVWYCSYIGICLHSLSHLFLKFVCVVILRILVAGFSFVPAYIYTGVFQGSVPMGFKVPESVIWPLDLYAHMRDSVVHILDVDIEVHDLNFMCVQMLKSLERGIPHTGLFHPWGRCDMGLTHFQNCLFFRACAFWWISNMCVRVFL